MPQPVSTARHATLHTAARVALVLALTLSLAACDAGLNGDAASSANASAAIGIVDLDQVAQELGRTQQWQAELQAAQQQAAQQLQNLDRAYKTQIENKQKEFGPNATPAQQQELRQLLVNARQRLQRDTAAAEQQFGNLRISLIANFRSELAPYIREIARERDLAIVLQKNTDLILFEKDTLDVTEPLINKLIASGLKASASAGADTDADADAATPAPEPAAGSSTDPPADASTDSPAP